MTSSVTVAKQWTRNATREDSGRTTGLRWRAWALDLRASWAKKVRRLGFSAARDHASTPVARKNVSFPDSPQSLLGELRRPWRRSHARCQAPGRVWSQERIQAPLARVGQDGSELVKGFFRARSRVSATKRSSWSPQDGPARWARSFSQASS
jgi:hypothetical protein